MKKIDKEKAKPPPYSEVKTVTRRKVKVDVASFAHAKYFQVSREMLISISAHLAGSYTTIYLLNNVTGVYCQQISHMTVEVDGFIKMAVGDEACQCTLKFRTQNIENL